MLVYSKSYQKWPRRNARAKLIALAAMLIATVPYLASTDPGHAANVGEATPQPAHAIAMIGDPALPKDFANMRYTSLDAKRGGTIRMSRIGSFDTLNPFTIRGRTAANVRGLVYQSLLARSYDEPFSLYALIAKSVTMPADRAWIEFEINPLATFSDQTPITAADVEFSMQTLRNHGRPNFANLYKNIDTTEIISPRIIRFNMLPKAGRETPLLLGLMPILPRHGVDVKTFSKTSMKFPIGSGPYVVDKVDPGRSIVYARSKHYWADDVPSVRKMFNFERIAYEYFLDKGSAREAFKAGKLDVWEPGTPSEIARMQKIASQRGGKILLRSYPINAPSGMDGLVMNSRRFPFHNKLVRKAITLLFDYETVARSIYRNKSNVIQSFWDRSDLKSCGTPADAREKKILQSFVGSVSDEAMMGKCFNPLFKNAPSQRERRVLASNLLKEAGYKITRGKWIHAQSGRALAFEAIYLTDQQERILLNFANTLGRSGITVKLRRVDSAQFQERKNQFEFDMIPNRWFTSLSPGTEQIAYWGRDSANQPGSRNYMGVTDPAIDVTIDHMLEAKTWPELVSAVRSLDRILLSGNWVIPLFHNPRAWIAHSNTLDAPHNATNFGYFIESWWQKPK